LDKKAAETFATQVKNLDPAVFGSCEAACWLKQVGWSRLMSAPEMQLIILTDD
jgi:hypothetical protein